MKVLTTGLCKGELVPLLWSDVDEKNMTISISKQAYRTKGALTAHPQKTYKNRRYPKISPVFMGWMMGVEPTTFRATI